MLRLVVFFLLNFASPVWSAIDAYPFPNEELAERYDNLIAELRCPQCLNTNLAGSDAMIAQDLRRETHRMVLEGYSDAEILAFMHERYGDFILYNPRISVRTFALWFGPVMLFIVAFLVLYRITRRKQSTPSLSEDDRSRLDELLGKSD
jgi:cytochrome c-type biogenesis protein CcmH